MAHETINNRCRTCLAPLSDLRRRTCEKHEMKQSAYMRHWLRNKQSRKSREKMLRRYRLYAKTHRDRDNDCHVRYRTKIKAAIVKAYGGKCICCGETELKFLTLHHPRNDGGVHRKELGVKAGVHYYRHILNIGSPKGLLEVLCFNCHMAGRSIGGCPHKIMSRGI